MTIFLFSGLILLRIHDSKPRTRDVLGATKGVRRVLGGIFGIKPVIFPIPFFVEPVVGPEPGVVIRWVVKVSVESS